VPTRCPNHLLAAAKAGDAIMAVNIPPTADKLRRLMNLGQLDPQKYYEYIGEAVQNSSYLKSPYYLPLGLPDGMYRVGPLARLNVAEQMGTPKADAELKKFKKLTRGRNAVISSFHYHYARLSPGEYSQE
jgi:NAD-reducing hydrogenase large subunit